MSRENVINAIELAFKHHSGQKRMTGEDYIVHPARVVEILRDAISSTADTHIRLGYTLGYSSTNNLICAAWMHDLKEDTKITDQEIIDKTSEEVLSIVLELTPDSEKIKELGKAEYLTQKMNEMSIDAFLIKLCDRLDNVSGIENVSEKFAVKYSKETKKILDGLKPKPMPISLRNCCNNLINRIREKIKKYEREE